MLPRCSVACPYNWLKYLSRGGGVPAFSPALRMAWWDTESKALDMLRKAAARRFVSLWECRSTAWSSADASRHPSLWRKAYWSGENSNCSLIRLDRILWRVRARTDEIAIGLKSLGSAGLSTLGRKVTLYLSVARIMFIRPANDGRCHVNTSCVESLSVPTDVFFIEVSAIRISSVSIGAITSHLIFTFVWGDDSQGSLSWMCVTKTFAQYSSTPFTSRSSPLYASLHQPSKIEFAASFLFNL